MPIGRKKIRKLFFFSFLSSDKWVDSPIRYFLTRDGTNTFSANELGWKEYMREKMLFVHPNARIIISILPKLRKSRNMTLHSYTV